MVVGRHSARRSRRHFTEARERRDFLAARYEPVPVPPLELVPSEPGGDTCALRRTANAR